MMKTFADDNDQSLTSSRYVAEDSDTFPDEEKIAENLLMNSENEINTSIEAEDTDERVFIMAEKENNAIQETRRAL
jgi:hypothetical protein